MGVAAPQQPIYTFHQSNPRMEKKLQTRLALVPRFNVDNWMRGDSGLRTAGDLRQR
jgi:hypothetical protein